jgi:hypothetical protein
VSQTVTKIGYQCNPAYAAEFNRILHDVVGRTAGKLPLLDAESGEAYSDGT